MAIFIIYLVCTTSGLILMKLGNNAGTIEFLKGGSLNFNISIVSLCGLVLYVISFLIFTKLVTSNDLSKIMPLSTGIVQILSLLAAVIIFKEKLTLNGVLGILLVIGGIFLMNLKK